MTEEEKKQIIGEIAEYSEYINSKFLKRRKARENNFQNKNLKKNDNNN